MSAPITVVDADKEADVSEYLAQVILLQLAGQEAATQITAMNLAAATLINHLRIPPRIFAERFVDLCMKLKELGQ